MGEPSRLAAGPRLVKPQWQARAERFAHGAREPLCYHSAQSGKPPQGDPLATRKEMSDFLASVERRAFKQGVYAVHDEEAALDIVQDSMLRLAEKYSDRPSVNSVPATPMSMRSSAPSLFNRRHTHARHAP